MVPGQGTAGLSKPAAATRRIAFDAAGWESEDDFYGAFLSALGAPDWHGRSVDALIDSIVFGGINAVEPPFALVVRNGAALEPGLRRGIESILAYLVEAAREERRGAEWLGVIFK
ncbi:barstar family protein [Sphingomonas sp.]|uniref:barstar family protein n=1 Tax=Sphingomonas sp. TaxID=28214 RepID=UPI0034544A8F